MTVTAIVGANWGDEGKGKLTDRLAEEARYVIRYQGGSNAGHTIVNARGKFALSMLPSGVLREGVTSVLGPGTAVNPEELFRELDGLKARGIEPERLVISDRAQLVQPYHMLFDALEEERLGDRRFGSTKSGIAPFYADKYAKLGIQAADLYDEQRLLARIAAALEVKNVLLTELYGQPPLEAEEIAARLLAYAERLKPYLADTTVLLHAALRRGEPMLLEGQLGALRDPDHGIWPYTTSSSTLAGFAPVGAGLPPYAVTRIIAVTKAYSSCVGEGPFVVELTDGEAEELRRRGGDAGEYGVKTGRPRRVGWFDAVATRYGCIVQGATEAALTNLDVLGYLPRIPVCVAYEADGAVSTDFPAPGVLGRAKPVYEWLPGWQTDITAVRRFADLPAEARAYVGFLEERIGVPIRLVSNGPRRDQLLERG